MHFQPEQFYHIYNRGNNKQNIFFEAKNYIFFVTKIRKMIYPFCEILAYCLMPNHYHLLIRTKEELEYSSILPRKMGNLQSSYAQAINKDQNKIGSLFQQKAKAKLLECNSDHLFYCFNYIHQNPYNAGLVEKLEDWEYSSFKDYAGYRNGTLINYDVAYSHIDLPKNPIDFIKTSYQVMSDDKKKKFYI